ncbi:MAG: hypothetical protein SNJ82_10940 [Gemmataceae bacterium]
MNNSILAVCAQSDARDPACVVVRVIVTPALTHEGLEIRGRLMGPTCLHAHTIEVAYALHPSEPLTALARIPEANLWHPVSPHLYAGPVELWHKGRLLDRRTIRLGFRTLSLTPDGLRVNGRLLPLHTKRVTTWSEAEARAWHDAGVNVLIAPAEPALFDLADRIGFLVACEAEAESLATVAHHPSCLGWLDAAARWSPDSPPVLASLPVELSGLRVMGA